jgi:predicted TIM-barrel fold metal-dependent hydrolase
VDFPVISADSHITEPPDTYVDRIDPKWRDQAPHLEFMGEEVGDLFVIPGMKTPVPMGLVAAAGKPAEEIRVTGVRFESLHRGGWDPEARLADQQRDGVAAEVLYPTVGMQLCNHKDFDYKRACFEAYNRWIAEYSSHPDRLLGCGQTDALTRGGHRGSQFDCRARPARRDDAGNPAVEDYDSPVYDAFWETAVELGLPLSFHILTTRETAPTRGPRMNMFLSVVRGCQDIMGTLVLGGVFERHPALKVVCVEADAGWVPHYMYRLDHVQASSVLAATGPGAVAPAVRVLRREHLRDVPGRLGGVQDRRPVELAPAHVGERLSPQRLHVAVVAGDARRARRGPFGRATPGNPLRERGVALRDRRRRAGRRLLAPSPAHRARVASRRQRCVWVRASWCSVWWARSWTAPTWSWAASGNLALPFRGIGGGDDCATGA